MDALREDDLRDARNTAASRKLVQALALMRDGIALQRMKLQLRFPSLSEDEIQALLERWLDRE